MPDLFSTTCEFLVNAPAHREAFFRSLRYPILELPAFSARIYYGQTSPRAGQTCDSGGASKVLRSAGDFLPVPFILLRASRKRVVLEFSPIVAVILIRVLSITSATFSGKDPLVSFSGFQYWREPTRLVRRNSSRQPQFHPPESVGRV